MTQTPVVVRNIGVDGTQERNPGGGFHHPLRPVGPAVALGCAAGEVDVHVVVLDGDLRANLQVGVPGAVRIDPGLAHVGAVGHGFDLLAGAPVRVVENRLDIALEVLGAVLLDELDHASLAVPDRAELRHQVAVEHVLVADVGEIHVDHVLTRLTLLVELDGGELKGLLPHVFRTRRHTRGLVRAAVELMALGDGPEEVLPLVEDRAGGDEVADVGVPAVGVVADDDVAVVDLALEGANHRAQDHVE